jgi:hypothetical protein
VVVEVNGKGNHESNMQPNAFYSGLCIPAYNFVARPMRMSTVGNG